MNRAILSTIAAGTALAAIAVTGCSSSGLTGGNAAEHAAQQADTTTLENNQPIPHYSYSQERQSLIAAETAAANGTQTTSFFFTQNGTQPLFQCPSIGMGVPDSASLSNPSQVVQSGDGGSGRNASVIGQEDPDGIYVPESSTGTFVNCLNGGGQEVLVRWEGDVLTVTSGATWSGGALKLVGAPTVHISTKIPATAKVSPPAARS